MLRRELLGEKNWHVEGGDCLIRGLINCVLYRPLVDDTVEK